MNRVAAYVAMLACVLLCETPAAATVYYLGGAENVPNTGTWMVGTWTNFLAQLNKLQDGDSLHIAGTISRTTRAGNEVGDESESPAVVYSNNVSILGGWDTTGGTWTRLDVANPANRSVLDSNLQENLLRLVGHHATLDGLVLREGNQRDSGNGGNLDITSTATNATVTQCSLLSGGNAGHGTGRGGGLYVGADNVVIRRCLFSANTCSFWGAHIHAEGPTNLRVTECRFTGAVQGPSLCLRTDSGKTITLDNCLVYNDRTNLVYSGNIAFINVTTHSTAWRFERAAINQVWIRNCIISESGDWSYNTDSVAGADVFVNNSLIDNLSSQQAALGGNVTVTFTDCLNTDAGNPPAFVAPGSGDFALGDGSAAFNIGNLSWLAGAYQGAVLGLPAAGQTDLAGRRRVTVLQADAGAYEKQFPRGTVVTIR